MWAVPLLELEAEVHERGRTHPPFANFISSSGPNKTAATSVVYADGDYKQDKYALCFHLSVMR